VEGLLEEDRPDKAERPVPFDFGRTEKGDLLSQMASKDWAAEFDMNIKPMTNQSTSYSAVAGVRLQAGQV